MVAQRYVPVVSGTVSAAYLCIYYSDEALVRRVVHRAFSTMCLAYKASFLTDITAGDMVISHTRAQLSEHCIADEHNWSLHSFRTLAPF